MKLFCTYSYLRSLSSCQQQWESNPEPSDSEFNIMRLSYPQVRHIEFSDFVWPILSRRNVVNRMPTALVFAYCLENSAVSHMISVLFHSSLVFCCFMYVTILYVQHSMLSFRNFCGKYKTFRSSLNESLFASCGYDNNLIYYLGLHFFLSSVINYMFFYCY